MWKLYPDPVLWWPVMLLQSVDFTCNMLSQPQGSVQVQGHDPFVWNPVPEDSFGNMPTKLGIDQALYTVQLHVQVWQGRPISLTITVKRGYVWKVFMSQSTHFKLAPKIQLLRGYSQVDDQMLLHITGHTLDGHFHLKPL